MRTNDVNDDGCANNWTPPECGDGVTQDAEECDDGNPSNTDLCTNACQAPVCGDGFVQPGEQCDHGNGGCTLDCKLPGCSDAGAGCGADAAP